MVVALTFFMLSVEVERIGGSRRCAAAIGLTALCFLIHPVTAAVLVACSAVLVACRVTPANRVREGVMLLLCVAARFVLALAARPLPQPRAIIRRYHARWLLLNQGNLGLTRPELNARHSRSHGEWASTRRHHAREEFV